MAKYVVISEGVLMTEDGVIVQTLGRQQTLNLWLGAPKSTVGVWASDLTLAQPIILSDGVQGSAVSYDFTVAKGTYTLDILHNTFTSRGIYTVAIDGTTITTIDGYYNPSGGPALFVDTAVANLFLDAGNHVLSFTMGAKNASASAYYGALNSALLTKGL